MLECCCRKLKKNPQNTNGRLAIPAPAGLLVCYSMLFSMQSTFDNNCLYLHVRRVHRTHSTRGNDRRASIPMQISTRLKAARLLILRRHFSTLREQRRHKNQARSSIFAVALRSSRLPRRRPSKYRCPIYIRDVGA